MPLIFMSILQGDFLDTVTNTCFTSSLPLRALFSCASFWRHIWRRSTPVEPKHNMHAVMLTVSVSPRSRLAELFALSTVPLSPSVYVLVMFGLQGVFLFCLHCNREFRAVCRSKPRLFPHKISMWPPSVCYCVDWWNERWFKPDSNIQTNIIFSISVITANISCHHWTWVITYCEGFVRNQAVFHCIVVPWLVESTCRGVFSRIIIWDDPIGWCCWVVGSLETS